MRASKQAGKQRRLNAFYKDVVHVSKARKQVSKQAIKQGSKQAGNNRRRYGRCVL